MLYVAVNAENFRVLKVSTLFLLEDIWARIPRLMSPDLAMSPTPPNTNLHHPPPLQKLNVLAFLTHFLELAKEIKPLFSPPSTHNPMTTYVCLGGNVREPFILLHDCEYPEGVPLDLLYNVSRNVTPLSNFEKKALYIVDLSTYLGMQSQSI